jgi:hypothetical protein
MMLSLDGPPLSKSDSLVPLKTFAATEDTEESGMKNYSPTGPMVPVFKKPGALPIMTNCQT